MNYVVLGVDCCTRWTNIGVSINGKVAAEMNMNIGRNQGSKLPILVETLVSSLGMEISDISAVAMTIGPGYFTGIRVGLAYGCGLAKGLGVPVIPISTLEAMGYLASKLGLTTIPLIWAGRGGVYGGAYRMEGNVFEEVWSPAFFTAEEIIVKSRGLQNKKTLCSICDDLERVSALFSEGGRTSPFPLVQGTVSGGTLALLGHKWKERAKKPDKIRPLYLREPDFGTFKLKNRAVFNIQTAL